MGKSIGNARPVRYRSASLAACDNLNLILPSCPLSSASRQRLYGLTLFMHDYLDLILKHHDTGLEFERFRVSPMSWPSFPVLFSAAGRYVLKRARDSSLPYPRSLLFDCSLLTHNQTRNHSRNPDFRMTTMAMATPTRPLNNSADPVERTSSPYPPGQLGPKSQLLASRTGNFHSTSLRLPSMVTVNTVNKTALHPGESHSYRYRHFLLTS